MEFDQRNLDMILGAIVATCNSLGLVSMNDNWCCISPNAQVAESFEMEPGVQVDPIAECLQPGEEEVLPQLGRLQRTLCQTDKKFACWLTARVPLSYQMNLERALFLQQVLRVLLACYPRSRSMHRWQCRIHGYPVFCKDSVGENIKHTLRLVLQPWPNKNDEKYLENWTHEKMYAVEILYYVVIARIVLVHMFRLYMRVAPSTIYRPNRRMKWLIEGRSMLSFPLTIAGVFLHVAVSVYNYSLAVYGDQELWNNAEWSPLHALYKFKDPWYDNMYVL